MGRGAPSRGSAAAVFDEASGARPRLFVHLWTQRTSRHPDPAERIIALKTFVLPLLNMTSAVNNAPVNRRFEDAAPSKVRQGARTFIAPTVWLAKRSG